MKIVDRIFLIGLTFLFLVGCSLNTETINKRSKNKGNSNQTSEEESFSAVGGLGGRGAGGSGGSGIGGSGGVGGTGGVGGNSEPCDDEHKWVIFRDGTRVCVPKSCDDYWNELKSLACEVAKATVACELKCKNDDKCFSDCMASEPNGNKAIANCQDLRCPDCYDTYVNAFQSCKESLLNP